MSDYKLNKYLAKLKRADDLKKANVYIAKILKYKQMGGQKGGYGDPIEDIDKAKEEVDAIKAKKVVIEEQRDKIEGINGVIRGITVGKGQTIDQEKLKEGVTAIFSKVKELMSGISELKAGDFNIDLEPINEVANEKAVDSVALNPEKIDVMPTINDAWKA